jgi:hypothetical protein
MWKMAAVTAGMAVVYLAWVFGHRWMENRRLRLRPAETIQLPEQYRTTSLKILEFYSPKPEMVCYGVLNAVKVRILPEPGDVAPSLSRCIEVPVKTRTTLTLTAESRGGEALSRTLVLESR